MDSQQREISGDTTPRIVAIETSGRQGSVAVAEGPRILAERLLSPNLRHAVELMPAIDALVREAGWEPRSIEQMYLSLGPGSFTGLRIAVAIARAMNQAIGCKVVGVPSLDVIVQNVGWDYDVVVPVLDAKRGQIFTALYQREGHGGLAKIGGPVLADPAEFVRNAVIRARPGTQVAVLGEGVDYHRDALLGGRADRVVEVKRDLWVPQARVVHALGWWQAQRGEFSDPAALLPIYIRLPEAEEVWRKKHGEMTKLE